MRIHTASLLCFAILLNYSDFVLGYRQVVLTSSGRSDVAAFAPQNGNAGRLPNIATRYEETSVTDKLFCGNGNDTHKSGYAHFTNTNGVEDKHLFWW